MKNKLTNNNNLRRTIITLIAVLTTCATAWAQDLSNLVEYSEIPTVTGGQSTNWSSTENYQMLVDGDTATKYGLSSNDPWVEFHYAQPITPVGYALWTANDEEGRRNPTNWTIKAKNAGDADWTTLVSVDNSSNNMLPMVNNTETRFALQNSTAYQYYRFEATRRYNVWEYQFQLAELRFLVVNEQPNEQTLTVYSGSDKSVHAPMKVYYFSNYTNAQSVYPASALGDMAGGTITAIKFYTDSEDIPYTTEATFNIYLTEVASTTISSFVTSGLSTVYTGTGSFEEEGYGGSITITLDTPYQYNGGNLLVGCQNTTLSSGYWRIYFYGQAVVGASISSFVYSAGDTFYPSAINFLAKATFTYTPDTHPYIALTPSSTTVFTGFTQTLTANCGTPTITDTTSDASVATVSGSGATATVTGVAPGTATITATINDTYTATCAITVEDLHYCTPYFYENTTCIMSFMLGGIWNSNSDFSSGGYGDFTSMSTTLEAGGTASATLGVFWTSYRYDAVAIWIDFNDDFIFDSSTERVGTGLFYGQSSYQSGSIDLSIPRTATRGSHRMRVVLQNNIYPTEIDPCVIGIYGECEDYMVEIVSPCKKPTGLVASDVTSYGATLDWTENGDATAWNIDVNGIVAQNVTTKPYPLTNLSPETSYTVKVAPVCEDEVWSDPITFTTSCPPYDGSITVSNITAYEATVNWTAVEGETYQFALAMTSMGAPGAYNNVTEMPVNLGNLQAQTDYTFYLRKDCGNGYFSDPVTVTFRTACEVVTSFPWSEDFESTPTGSPNIPECWERIASYGTNPIHPYVSNFRPHGGHNCLYMYSFSGSGTNIIALPEMNGIHTKEILFWACDGAGIPGMFEVGYVKNGNFTTLEQVTLTTSYQEFIIPLNNAPADAERIALSSSNSVIVYVDDIIVRDLMPTHIVASNPSEGQMTWEEFAQIVNGGYTYEGKTVYLDEDITATTKVGGLLTLPFMGTFDGQGHTVTFNCGTASYPDQEWLFCAPFQYVEDATFQNLKVTGNIYSQGGATGGIAGTTGGNASHFINCESNISIDAQSGGGFVGFVYGGSSVFFDGCVFTGSFYCHYDNKIWAGFVLSIGPDNIAETRFNNCVFAPTEANVDYCTFVGISNDVQSPSQGDILYTNCYYTQALDVLQGKQMYSIGTTSYITAAMEGEATVYDVSHITAYSDNQGLVYNNTLIAGEGDNVALNLYGGITYEVSHGTLNGTANPYTLTMAANNTTIAEIPPSPPYSTGFEETCGWTLVNGSCTNAWVWGTAAHNGEGTHCLYISNDGGTTNAYDNTSTMVYAYKTFLFDTGIYNFAYDWNAYGENNYDFLRVALVPATVSLEAGTALPSGFSYSALPSGWIALDGGSQLNQASVWNTMSQEIEIATAGHYNVVFAWRNDNSVGTNPPAAIDNVSIEVVTCSTPLNFSVSNLTATTADLGWAGSILTDSYTVKYRRSEIIFTEGFEDGIMPSGWTQSGPGTWDVTQGYGFNSIGTHNGTYNATINHTSRGDETFLVTPMLDLSGQSNPCLSFWYINFNWGSADIDQLYVYYRVNEGEWIELWNTTEDHQEWTESGFIPLPNPSANYQIGFKMIDKWGRGVGIDDIVISSIVPAGEWQTATVAGNATEMSTTLTGLMPETEYEAFVYPNCNPNKKSEIVGFTTEAGSLFSMTIAGYGTTDGNWHLIASPVTNISPDNVEGMTDGDYDLYRFSPSDVDLEWRNYEAEDVSFNLEAGKGYLYARSTDATLTFVGTPYSGNGEFELVYDANDDHKCWNLVGNPFNCNAYLNKDYYILNAEGTGINPAPVSSDISIPPFTAVFVKAVSAGDKVVFIKHKYVDLGLPSGLLWATCNIGANAPEEYGDYFAWGETQPENTYNWNTYQYCMGSNNNLTKYCDNSNYGYNGFTDGLTTLLPEDDAATANWGNGWRMPTKVEFEELYNNTTVTRTQQNGVNGTLFTAANGNTLFLPAAGYRDGSYLNGPGDWGNYWSSSLLTGSPNYAWYLHFNSDDCEMWSLSRYLGHSVRPVHSAVQH